jgi:tetratricopeptide (TPR) repeat protein
MTHLPDFTPALTDRLTAELLDQSLTLLAVPLTQDVSRLDTFAWRFSRPEPPRDPDLPLLPAKVYPSIDPLLVEATIKALQPPPPVSMFTGRRAELDRAVGTLLNERAAVITGETGIGKSALLRQLAADPRIKNRFRRVWWFSTIQALGDAVGLALELPQVLRLDPADQPAMACEFLHDANALLLIDHIATADELAYALHFGAGVAVAADQFSAVTGMAETVEIRLTGLNAESAVSLLGGVSDLPDINLLLARTVGNPRALKIGRALISEDDLTPTEIVGMIGENPIADLFDASYAALPVDYQTVCGWFAAIKPGAAVNGAVPSIEMADFSARFPSPLTARRALNFLEARAFLERTGETISAVPGWQALVAGAQSTDPLPTIGFPAVAFRAHTDTSTPDDARLTARVLHDQGVKALDERRDTEAESLLTQALELRQQQQQTHAAAETLVALARLAYLHNDDVSAIRQLEAAAELVHGLRDSESLDIVRIALSRAYRRAGRLDAALSILGDDAPPEDLFALYAARGDWEAALHIAEGNADPIMARRQVSYALVCAGRYAEALQTIANSGLNSDDFDARLARAYIYHAQGDYGSAITAYERADSLAARETDRGALARARARALAAAGRYREAAIQVGAEGVWHETRQPRPVFARQQASQALYATLSLIQGDLVNAENAARIALDCPGERPDLSARAAAAHVLARIAVTQADTEQALAAYQESLAARQSFGDRDELSIGLTLHTIGDQYLRRGDTERAIAQYRRALTHLTQSNERRTRLTTLLALQSALDQAGRTVDCLEIGAQALDLGLSRPEADLPLVGYLLCLQARALWTADRSTRAAPLFQEWINRLARGLNDLLAVPDNPRWELQMLAMSLVVRGVLCDSPGAEAFSPALLRDLAEEAVSIAETHVPNTPSAWAARRDLGEVLTVQERWPDAAAAFAPLVEAAALTPIAEQAPLIAVGALSGAARVAVKREQYADAIRLWDTAAMLEPDPLLRGRFIRESAAARVTINDPANAELRYQDALKLLPREQVLDEHVGVLVDLAYTRLRAGKFSTAIDTFETTLSIVRELPDPALMASVLVDLANAHRTLGQYRSAANVYRRALNYLTGLPRALTLIALAQTDVALADYAPALAAYHDALRADLSPETRRTVQIELAATYVAHGQRNLALENYQNALTLPDLSSAQLASIHRGLAQLYTAQAQYDQARYHFEQAMQAVAVDQTNAGQDDQTGLTLRAIADGYLIQQQEAAALDAYLRALPHLDRATYPLERAAVSRIIGDLYVAADRHADALPMYESTLEIERALPQQDGGRIVSMLQKLAASHEWLKQLDRAIIRHHEALVYQDVRHAPEAYAQTLYTLGRLYSQIGRFGEAAKALEDALATDYNRADPNPADIRNGTKLLADAYRRLNRLLLAAELYHRLQSDDAVEPSIRADIEKSLRETEREITRHRQTLEAAKQSWAVMNRAPQPDLKSLAFILALQAQVHGALQEWDASTRSLDQMVELLNAHRAELSIDSPQPALRALALLLSGYDAETQGDPEAAQAAYRQALAFAERRTLAQELIWVLRHKLPDHDVADKAEKSG